MSQQVGLDHSKAPFDVIAGYGTIHTRWEVSKGQRIRLTFELCTEAAAEAALAIGTPNVKTAIGTFPAMYL